MIGRCLKKGFALLMGIALCGAELLSAKTPEDILSDQERDKIKTLQIDYDLELLNVREVHWDAPMMNLRTLYRKRMDQIQTSSTKAGDLAKAVTARDSARQDPTLESIEKEIPEIASVQRTFLLEQSKIRKRHDQEALAKSELHLKELTKIMNGMAKANRLESALAVKKVIDAVRLPGVESFQVAQSNSQQAIPENLADPQANRYFVLGQESQAENTGKQGLIDAVKFYQLAADKGHAAARRSLGYMYSQGLGTEPDKKKAIELYRLAAAQGDAVAQWYLGFHYYNPERGDGLTRNYQEAEKWVRKAADQGLAAAQNAIGAFYLNGHGVEKDPEEALKWLRAAAAQGHAQAIDNLRILGQSD